MKRFLLFSVLFMFVLFIVGCSSEDTSPIIHDSISPPLPLTLILAENDTGQVIVSSPNGQSYTEETLQEAIKVAVQNSQALEIRILPQLFDEDRERSIAPTMAPPQSSLVRTFISDVTPVWDGMTITLTDLGLSLGLSWQSAWTLACYTMFEYEFQEPLYSQEFYRALREQVRLEICYHSIAFYYWHSPKFRTINISFWRLP